MYENHEKSRSERNELTQLIKKVNNCLHSDLRYFSLCKFFSNTSCCKLQARFFKAGSPISNLELSSLTCLGVVKVFKKLEAVAQAGKDGELALEGVLPEEQVEDGHVLCLARLPVGVGHGDLVQVCGASLMIAQYFANI